MSQLQQSGKNIIAKRLVSFWLHYQYIQNVMYVIQGQFITRILR